MSDFRIVAVRGPLDESVHHVSAVALTAAGKEIARVGDPEMVTFWRSASKPFQLLPVVEDGGVERFGLDAEMLALGCGSHNAEPIHREVGRRWLDAVALEESQLSCGGHASLWATQAERMIREDVTATPLWSNCSGKHAGLLALAKLHGWHTEGYEALEHPVQDRVSETIARWTGVPARELIWGVDGCTAAAVALPLVGMARAYAALGAGASPALAALRDAMMTWPMMVAGSERIDTVLMEAWPGRVVAKIGAEGVFSAALPTLGIGMTLKVHDGDMRCAGFALVALLQQLVTHCDPAGDWPMDRLAPWHHPTIRNTRGVLTGTYEARGGWQFTDMKRGAV
jgi:L-asparaginase II